MTPTMSHHARCSLHPHTPLSGADCPRCLLLPTMAAEAVTVHHIHRPSSKQTAAREMQAKVNAGKPGNRRTA